MLERILRPRAELAYALLRIVSGFAFSLHGFSKIFGVFGGFRPAMGTMPWFAGVIEIVCGVAIALGLRTTWAAFLASGTMAVAYIKFHWKGQLGPAFFPSVNKGELALLYCFLFFFIACRGTGILGLDRGGKR